MTGARIRAERENLGDLKLYRIPIPVTVASRSQKQVALIEQPAVKVSLFYKMTTYFSSDQAQGTTATRVMRTWNRKADGLGLPLPAGTFSLFTDREGQPFLLGEGTMTDRAGGEKVEVPFSAPGVRVRQTRMSATDQGGKTEIVVTNDQAIAAPFELELRGNEKLVASSAKLVRRDGAYHWVTTIPAGGSRTLTVSYKRP